MSSFTNLSRLIGHCLHENANLDHLRYAVVKNGVVSVTNGNCIIRRPVPGIPNGKYHFGFGDQLIPADEIVPTRLDRSYPDIDLIMPKQEHLFDRTKFALIGTLDQNTVTNLSAYVHRIKLENDMKENGWSRERVMLTSEGVCVKDSMELDKVTKRVLSEEEANDFDIDSETAYFFKIMLPIKLGLGNFYISFSVDILSVALVELQQYETVSILRRIIDDEKEPFFIGAGLDRCAIIVPYEMEEMDGQYIR